MSGSDRPAACGRGWRKPAERETGFDVKFASKSDRNSTSGTDLARVSRLQRKSPHHCGLPIHGRYWARTSDPQLVEPVRR